MTTIINGSTDAITFPDATIQNTSAVVSGKVPYSILPSGSILQVQFGSTPTQVSSSNNSRVDTGITASITPKSASNKILILVNIAGVYLDHTNPDNRINFYLMRNATDINNFGAFMFTPSLAGNLRLSHAFNWMDTTYSTTSTITYKVQFSNAENSGTVAVQKDSNSGNSTITLMEIAA